jgi:hypothetical protein
MRDKQGKKMFRFTSSTINVGLVLIKEYLPKQPNLNKSLKLNNLINKTDRFFSQRVHPNNLTFTKVCKGKKLLKAFLF